MASHDMLVSSIRLVHLWFQSHMTISIMTLLQQARYEVVICFRKSDIRDIFLLGGNWQAMLGGNIFHPVSSRYFIHWKLTYVPLQRLWFRYTHIYGLSSISTKTKTHKPIHQLLTAGSNSSLRGRGHVGCSVEHHCLRGDQIRLGITGAVKRESISDGPVTQKGVLCHTVIMFANTLPLTSRLIE